MKKTKISIIVPVYNVEKYIKKCLDTLVNQTLNEIEIIVVNDGSKDNSQKIIDEYSKKYKNIKSFIKENGGLSSARNFGVAHATGEYIAFVDSDDYVEANMYELLCKKADEDDADVVVCSYNYVYETKIQPKTLNSEVFGTNVIKSPDILQFSKSFAWNKIYRHSFYKKNNFIFPDQWFEDSAIMYEILALANKVSIVNIPLYYYRKEREGAITYTVNPKIYDIFKSSDRILQYFSNEKYEKLIPVINNICVGHIIFRMATFNKIKSKECITFVKTAKKYMNKNIKDWKKTETYKLTSKTMNYKLMLLAFKFPQLFMVFNNSFIRPFLTLIFSFLRKILSFSKKCLKRILGISKKEIAKKREMIQINGYEVLEDIFKIMDSLDVLTFADFGTLLGLIREGKLLSHDLDMDIGLIDNKNVGIQKIEAFLKQNGFILWRTYFLNDKIVEQSYYYKGIKVDFNYYESDKKHSYTWLFYRDPKKKYKENRDVVKMTYSKIDKMKQIVINDRKISIPSNAKTILKEKYGPNWTVPDKKWIYWQSPAATKIDGEGYFITYSKL